MPRGLTHATIASKAQVGEPQPVVVSTTVDGDGTLLVTERHGNRIAASLCNGRWWLR